MKRSKRKRLTNRLDDLCRQIVRLRDDNRCQWCNKQVEGQDSHPSHVLPKGRGASWRRFDLLNIKLLCFNCHRQKWHASPVMASAWFIDKFPVRAKYLHERYGGNKPAKISDSEMRELIEQYKQKVKELE